MNVSLDREHIDRATRLVEYLLQLASLRTKIVRDISEYEKVIWLSEVPRQKGCFTQAWGRDESFDPDVWAEIQNRREPDIPVVPDRCKDWIDSKVLRNKNDLPELLPEISRQIQNPNWQEGSDTPEFIKKSEQLANHPEVQKRWDQYVESQWLPWTEEHSQWESVHSAYSTLFAIHQEQLRLGEEYELVLGFGLLTWITPLGQHIRRHLIVAGAFLEFDARIGRFIIHPNPDGANLRPELDMLDIEEQPQRAEELAKSSLQEAADDPWERSCIDGVLKSLVHSLSSQGEFYDHIERNQLRFTTKPVVEYTPALILRKRSTRGLTEALKRIRERIEQGEQIPTEFADLAELKQTDSCNDGSSLDQEDNTFRGEIFFPKPSNDEQRRIVDKMRIASGVLVQGPPGTGKSHTIANLICHLLATGNRILITAKTPRALQVLMGDMDDIGYSSEKGETGLIPVKMRPLCINLLGTGLSEKRSLGSSVGGILRENERWDEKRTSASLTELEQKLCQLREEKARVDRRLREIRESETYVRNVAQGNYRGTAAQIAEAVHHDRNAYEWFSETVPIDGSCPVTESDFIAAVGAVREFPPEKRRELSLEWPTNLPTPEVFHNFVDLEILKKDEETRFSDGVDPKITERLINISQTQISAIRDTVSAFQDVKRRLLASNHRWINEAVVDILNGNSHVWSELNRITRESITLVEPLVKMVDDTRVDLSNLSSPDHKILFEDVSRLCNHIEGGGGLGFGPFRPQAVKDCLYIRKRILVNGRRCTELGRIQSLRKVLNVIVAFETIQESWGDRIDRTSGPYVIQLQTFKTACEALTVALALEDLITQCQSALNACLHIPKPIWADESQVESLVLCCELALIRQAIRHVSEQIRTIEEPVLAILSNGQAHPVARELFEAIRSRNTDSYQTAYAKASELDRQKSALHRMNERLDLMRRDLPRTVRSLEQTISDASWDYRSRHIEDTWRWAQAKAWLEDYVRQEDVPALAKRSKQIEDEIGATIAQCASLRAWGFCFSRLTERHRRHMKAWQQNVGKITKSGTGKQDLLHRRAAQENLNNCREAIPAWVMPLHRVWDTVDPIPAMFDVIIVDEASQCGFEAIPLFYLGKKILIVGDDKQISPEAELVKKEPVNRLIEKYLYDFEYKTSFNVDRSLFDQGKLRYSLNHVVLTEHFRCVPEIIRFSNDLCYKDTPLIPLRECGPDRLKPLERVFIEHGYREGSDSRVINRPEAGAIAEKIFELCKNPKYTGKTIGVVVLQGKAQGELIESSLLKLLGAEEMKKRRLVCGDSYSFQGDQRDVMFLSMVAAPNERIGPLTRPADERRFNVAASRARDQMWLFHSVSRDDLSSACLRRRLLEFFDGTEQQVIAGIEQSELEYRAALDNRSIVKPPQPFDSWFEVDVALELVRKGFMVIPQVEIAGKRIDLVIEGGHARISVECDGDAWHGPDQYEADMHRQRILERCGREFFRIRESEFKWNKEKALAPLWRLLEERDIFPVSLKTTTVTNDIDAETNSLSEEECSENEDLATEFSLFEDSANGSSSRRRPDEVSASEIQQAIVESLRKCPNQSCTLQSLTSRVLRELGVLTRGTPRMEFEKRVMRNLAILENREFIEKYRAKNKRVRLLESKT